MVVRGNAAQPYRICRARRQREAIWRTSVVLVRSGNVSCCGARSHADAEHRETREDHRAKPEQACGDLMGPTTGSAEL